MNISTKSTKAECRTDVMKADILLLICYHSIPKFITKIQIERHKYILGTPYLVLLNATLGARQAHDSSVRLIFPALVLLFTKK